MAPPGFAALGVACADKAKAAAHGKMTGLALTDRRVWMLSALYFGLIYGLYAIAFFLPTIISGFEECWGSSIFTAS